jgi:hypothetical protein
LPADRVGPHYFALSARRADQSGGKNSWAGTVATTPTLFNTPEADAIRRRDADHAVTSAWNEDISRRPVLANSAAMIAQVKSDLLSKPSDLARFLRDELRPRARRSSRLTIPFFNYPDESDLDGGRFRTAVSDPAEHAGRRLAEGDWRPDLGTMAAGCERYGRRLAIRSSSPPARA